MSAGATAATAATAEEAPPGPSATAALRPEGSEWDEKLVLVMVGLPARGKSFTAKKIVKYMNWLGIPTQIFNVGKYRRTAVADKDANSFFDTTNKEANKKRDELALYVLDVLLDWLEDGGRVAIFDATNTTRDRRRFVREHCDVRSSGLRVVCLENICNDEAQLKRNYTQKVSNSPDYTGVPFSEAMDDFLSRVANYEKVYEPVEDDEDISYIKLIDLCSKIMAKDIGGSMSHKILNFVTSVHICERPIFLTRVGVGSDPNAKRGDANTRCLTREDREFGHKISALLARRVSTCYSLDNVVVFTGTTVRACEFGELIGRRPRERNCLNALNRGDLSELSILDMREFMSNWPDWNNDPFTARFPGGESLEDRVGDLEHFIVEIERIKEPLVIVTHYAIVQLLYAYFLGIPVCEAVDLDFPHGQVLEFVPTQYSDSGWNIVTHRVAPARACDAEQAVLETKQSSKL